MNAEELRSRSQGDLQKHLTGLLHEQFNLRMQKGSGQMVTPHQMRQVRKNIARVKTVLNEKSKEGKSE